MCSKFPAIFALFPVLSRGYAHTKLSPLYLLSTFGAFHVTKSTRLSTPAQLQCSRSRAWEPGNEATTVQHVQNLVSVPDPKPTPARIAFSIVHGERHEVWGRD